MSPRIETLFRQVREACSPAQWSHGVELSRSGSVFLEEENEDEVVFRVAVGSRVAGRTVRIFPDDEEWECGCDSPNEACEHVAAAVILWKRASEEGRSLEAATPQAGYVRYRFERTPGGLALGRSLVAEGGEVELGRSLAALARNNPKMHAVAAGQADLAVEVALGGYRGGTLPRQLVAKLFARLARCREVRLDDETVEVSPEPLQPIVRVEDQDDGFRVVLVDDPSVSERFANGIVLCGRTLRPEGESRLTGRELHELPRGVRYGSERLAELMTEVLPSLRRRARVEVRTERLPESVKEAPRIRIETERSGEELSVLATLVYGEPPRARVDAGRLVHLEGAMPVRDEPAERRLVRRLGRELQLAPGVRADLRGEEAVAFCARLERWEGARPDPEVLSFFRVAGPLQPAFVGRGDDFDLRFESIATAGGGSRGSADPARVLRAWREGASLVPLLEGGWAALPADWLERYGRRIADLLAARETGEGLPPACIPDLAALCEALDQPAPPSFDRLSALVRDFDGIPTAELPDDLRAELRPYQRVGVDWLSFLRQTGLGGLLADDMGLGKTLQALCAIRGRTLVVCPTSVLHNWAEEIGKFRPGLRPSVYHGPDRELDPAADVTLTTYALLRIDVDRLTAEPWSTVVLDESQAIKNPESQVARAAFRLRADFRVALTGTPVENRLDELWSQFHFVNRGLLGGRSDFQQRYAVPIAAGEAEAARRLRERIRPFVLRRLKQEVAPELPPRTDLVLYCELDPEERTVYDAIRATTLSEVVDRLDHGAGVIEALEALLRLRQAACHRALVPGQEAAGSSKLRTLTEALENVVAEGHKAVVFSQWTSLLDLTEPELGRSGIGYTRLDGSTRDRGAVVRSFQDEAGPPVMLVSLRAGGTGLNLTAADHVFLLDPWWNPAVEDQAADRTHRIGQDRPVFVYRLVAEQTVEERILALQTRKREIADAALGQADAAASITRAELMELLR